MSKIQPIVTIEDGQLQGTIKLNCLGGEYYSFQGIPYAKSPVGKLRFKPPQPVEPWIGIKDATKEGSDCYSRNLITQQIVGSEDCLFLNVYTPKLPRDDNELKAVMVWIHGGAFLGGSGRTELYGPEFLVVEDVVIVTINYRLGFLGFSYFTEPSLGVPGNAALKDQVLALKWVQKNISKFGGNPENVTIFGESAGGTSVHFLMLSPLAKGLFHRAIAQSCVATGEWAKGQPTAPVIAKILGLQNASEHEIFKILSEMPVERILEIHEKFPHIPLASKTREFGVVIESANDKSSFLTRHPYDIIKSGTYNHVPFMIGYTSREGMMIEMFQKMHTGEIKLISDFREVLPRNSFPIYRELSNTIAERVKQFYYGIETPSLENMDQYYMIYTDVYFLIDINNVVRAHTKTSSCPTYYYRMSVDTNLNIFKKFGDLVKPGVAHGDDIGYLFKTVKTPNIRPRSLEDISMKRFVKLWTTFAKYGDPNPVQKNDLINVTWPPTENRKLHFLDIGENLTVGVNPDKERMDFWDEMVKINVGANKL